MFLNSSNNVKIHFAGCEVLSFIPAFNVSGIRYALHSVYPLIGHKFGLPVRSDCRKALKIDLEEIPSVIAAQKKHTIMDSGIFTLAYGAQKGCSQRLIDKWYDEYVRFVNMFTPKHVSIVEVDSQSIVSPNHAWSLRRNLRHDCPKHTQINVWHFEDGRDGLDEMIDFTDYIGFSVPEYKRIIGNSKATTLVMELCRYAKKKKPSIKIHLLGCTDVRILSPLKDIVYSADSTSWVAIGKYGGRTSIERGISSANIEGPIRDACMEEASKIFHIEKLSDGMRIDIVRRALALKYHKDKYCSALGSQE